MKLPYAIKMGWNFWTDGAFGVGAVSALTRESGTE
jgi:hypothetical protein